MSIVTWPDYKVSSFRWRKADQALTFRSAFGSQSLTIGAPLWEVTIAGTPEYWRPAAQIDTFFESLDGFKNQLELWHLAQPVPYGTMRGSLTLSADAAQGAISLVIGGGSGQALKTLLKGDLLGIGSGITQQVVRVSANTTSDVDGVITVPIGTPLRNVFVAGAAVVWNKPKALFRLAQLNEGFEYRPVVAQPWSLALIEDWKP